MESLRVPSVTEDYEISKDIRVTNFERLFAHLRRLNLIT